MLSPPCVECFKGKLITHKRKNSPPLGEEFSSSSFSFQTTAWGGLRGPPGARHLLFPPGWRFHSESSPPCTRVWIKSQPRGRLAMAVAVVGRRYQEGRKHLFPKQKRGKLTGWGALFLLVTENQPLRGVRLLSKQKEACNCKRLWWVSCFPTLLEAEPIYEALLSANKSLGFNGEAAAAEDVVICI